MILMNVLKQSLIFFMLGTTFLVQAQTESLPGLEEQGMNIDSVLNVIEEEQPVHEEYPASVLYHHIWEHNNIRYPQTSFNVKDDTIRIVLVGENDRPYVHPYKGRVISKYGPRSGRMHTGTDIKLLSGDSVLCAFDGRVRLARVFSGYGNMVLVRHNNGLETIYSHLKSITVQVNDTLKAGDLVGYGGRTGRATTDHLHFETRLFGDPFDSNKYIDFDNYALRGDTLYYLNKKVSVRLEDLLPKPPQHLAAKTQPDGSLVHVIEQGDNLWKIARMYNTTVNQLCQLNNITTQQILKIGVKLYVQ